MIIALTYIAAFAFGVWFKFWFDKESAKARKELEDK